MRGILNFAVGIFVVAANGASEVTCATGLYILCARGSGEPAFSPTGIYPNNTGSPGYLALQVAKQIDGSVIDGVVYPATDPLADGTLDLPAYVASEDAGAEAILEQVNQYHLSCPDSKIALMGYSQVCATRVEHLC